MDRTEDELRGIYEHQNPPADFTARVMERVRAEGRGPRFPFWRWGVAAAVAASLFVGVHVEQNRRSEQRRSAAAAEQAEAELMFSLQIAGAKINQAREVVLRNAGRGTQ